LSFWSSSAMRRILVKEDVCIGCRLCEVYCILQHSQTRDILKAFMREKPKPMARIIVEEEGPLSFGTQCANCDEPACVYACISGALFRRGGSDGTVQLDEQKCIGCWTCIAACPHGAIQRSKGRSPTAVKCDMCFGADVPACVANCPNEALVLEEDEAA